MASLPTAPMPLAIRQLTAPFFLLAALLVMSAPVKADSTLLALAERTGLPAKPGYHSLSDENDAPSLIPLPDASPRAVPAAPADKPIPEVQRDFGTLPEPVRRMRERMLEAARSGEIERLRPLLGDDDNPTRLSFDDHDEDAIDALRSLAGDEAGREILAILVDLLDTGYVHLNAGTDEEAYVWPYFTAVPLDRLTPPQIVELLQIVTAGDMENMKKAGGYIFYSIGIAPDGSWRFFTAGE